MTIEKNKSDHSEGDDSNLPSSNKLLKVSSGITLPKENKSLFDIYKSIYAEQEYEELKNLNIKEQNDIVENKRTRYTTSSTIDEIKKILASIRSTDLEEERNLDERLYYYQAYDFQKLGLYKRGYVPTFKIKLNHLPHDIIYELSTFDANTRRFVLKQAVSRIFEDINFDLYHNSISNRLEVSLVD
jgi:hypothetical protein